MTALTALTALTAAAAALLTLSARSSCDDGKPSGQDTAQQDTKKWLARARAGTSIRPLGARPGLSCEGSEDVA